MNGLKDESIYDFFGMNMIGGESLDSAYYASIFKNREEKWRFENSLTGYDIQ